jgi:hypothetical protein
MQTQELGIMPIEQLYIRAIAGLAEDQGFACAMQDLQPNGAGNLPACRLWLIPENTTIPAGCVNIAFNQDGVAIELVMRNDRTLSACSIRYAEGLDGWLQDATRFLQAGLLADKRKG